MTAGARRGRILFGALVALITVTGTAGTASAAQEDSEGLRAEATTTYLFDASAGTVHVTVEVNLRNTVPDQREGNVIRQAYFTGFGFLVPLGAAEFAATADGESLTVAGQPFEGSDEVSLVEVAFASNLFYNDALDLVVAYDLTGEAPRSDGVSRINPAYASFEAYGVGDPGLSTVRVIIPTSFEVESFGEAASETIEGDNRVFTAAGVDFGWFMFVSARNDEALVSTPGAAGAVAFEVRAWPDDKEWAQFVTDTVTSGAPALSDLVGQPWPLDGTLLVREAITPHLYGYAGWFNAVTGTIEVGEDLDQEVVLHELSHAWFNRDLFSDRWLNEGMAQTYASAALTALGGMPDAPTAIDTDAPGAMALVDWTTPSVDDDTARAQEEFGYNASWFVVDSLVDEIGTDAMKGVIAAADAGTIAYVGDATAEEHSGAVGWRTFLDMAEELGGSTALEPVIRAHVARPGDHDVLDDRIAARVEYEALEVAGGEWAPPLGVRDHMADWDFDDAHLGMQAATAVLASRDELSTAAAQLDLAPPSGPEAGYESVEGNASDVVDGLSEVDAELGAHAAALGRIETLTASVDEAMKEFAPDGLLADLDSLLGPVRDAFEGGAIESVAELGDDAAATLADRVEAATVLRAVAAAEARDQGVFARIGLLGTDLDGELVDARAALERGDPDRARRLAAGVDAQLDDASSVGQRRALAGSGATLWGVLVLATAVLLVRNRRRPMAPATTSGADVAAAGPAPAAGVAAAPQPEAAARDAPGDCDSS